jgi:hypothetical protein
MGDAQGGVNFLQLNFVCLDLLMDESERYDEMLETGGN